MHARILSRFSHDQVSVTLWTVAHQAPLSVGILQARILEWVDTPSSGIFPTQGSNPCVSYMSYISRQALYHQRHL